MGTDQGGTVTLRNVRFVNCTTAVREGGYYNYPNVNIYNGLIHNATTAFSVWYGGNLTAQHLTVNNCGALGVGQSIQYGPSFNFANSIFASVSSLTSGGIYLSGQNNGFYQTSQFGSDAHPAPSGPPFQTAAAGAHYLANNDFRGEGTTTGIDSQLLAELKTKTTHPPSELTAPMTTWTPLYQNPNVPRDTSNNPDLGWHYDPLDYLLNQVDLSANLTLSGGVAVGVRGSYGLKLLNGAVVFSQGGAQTMNRVTRYATVQEQPTNIGGNTFIHWTFTSDAEADLIFRFTELTLGQGRRNTTIVDHARLVNSLSIRDCRMWGCLVTLGSVNPDPVNVDIVNNLFERSSVILYRYQYDWDGQYHYTPLQVDCYNNLFRGGEARFTYWVDPSQNPAWFIRDNLFHGATTYLLDASSGTYVTRSHNGFTAGTANNLGGTDNKTGLAPDFEKGPLGDYYYEVAGDLSQYLIDAGSRTAFEADLSSYTVTPDEAPDGGDVDIGYHHVKLDSSGADFWLTFFYISGPFGDHMQLMISAGKPTTGTVSIPGLVPQFNEPFSITPGVVTVVELPIDAMLSEFDQIQSKGIHVTAAKPVSVHALSYGTLASEAYLGYPVSMLGSEYRLMARASNSDLDAGQIRSQFAVVASENDTEVVIQPSATADLDKMGHQGTDPIALTLNQGETYQLRSRDKDDDVTGTLITANKPIVVLAGARGARVPNEGYESENPLLEQQLPLSAWPIWVLGFPLAERGFPNNPGDFYRIVASRNNTLVSMNGVQVATLQAGQFWDTPQAVTIPVEFGASQPIQVAQFATGNDFGGFPGDPFELLLSAPRQYLSSYTVSAPAGQPGQYAVHYLALIVETSELDTTFVDSLSVSQWALSQSVSFVPIGNSGYSGAAIEVQEGDHVAAGPKPFGLMMYGYGVEGGTYEGYGYIGGLHY